MELNSLQPLGPEIVILPQKLLKFPVLYSPSVHVCVRDQRMGLSSCLGLWMCHCFHNMWAPVCKDSFGLIICYYLPSVITEAQ